jgi:hypothetical protein
LVLAVTVGGIEVTWAAIIAVYAAIVSTATLAWTVYNGLRDRAKVKVTAELRIILPDKADVLHLIVRMVNVGRRPIRLKGVYGQRHGSDDGANLLHFMVITRQLPKNLTEAEEVVEYTDGLHDLFDQGELKRLYVSDSTGREWDASEACLEALHREWLEALEGETVYRNVKKA